MLALVSRYVVNSEPRSEASTGAKKSEDSFRKAMFILFRLVGVCVGEYIRNGGGCNSFSCITLLSTYQKEMKPYKGLDKQKKPMNTYSYI